MKKLKALKKFEWSVCILEHNPGWKYFDWEATCDKYKLESRVQYNSLAHAKGAFREFAQNEGIKNFKFTYP